MFVSPQQTSIATTAAAAPGIVVPAAAATTVTTEAAVSENAVAVGNVTKENVSGKGKPSLNRCAFTVPLEHVMTATE